MAKASDVLDIDPAVEPEAIVPEHAGGEGDHESIVADAYNEGEADALLEEIGSAETEPTADDLRKIGGADAEGLTDEQLLAEYQKAVAGAGAEGDDTTVDADTKVAELPFPVYDAQGNKITSEKLTLGDLLAGKVQIGYNAMGKEQRKSLSDILRVAANGHYNESKMAGLMSERQAIAKQLADMKAEHTAWGADRKVWDRVLSAYANGNAEPLKKLINAYSQEMAKGPAEAAPVDTTAHDRELEAAGQRYVLENIVPAAQKMASDYGANATEITNAILHAIGQEPPEFLTREKIEAIINYEIPSLLEQNGYTRNGAAAVVPAVSMTDEVAALKKQVQELTAGKANAATEAVRNRAKKAPASGGGSTPGAGEGMPNLKSREDMKKWMRGEI